jgi:cobalt transporter subunit CbtB
MLLSRTSSAHDASISHAAARRCSALAAALLGALILFGVGFAQSETVHSAAHDARHAQGFPCH